MQHEAKPAEIEGITVVLNQQETYGSDSDIQYFIVMPKLIMRLTVSCIPHNWHNTQ
jgi:hypothetical protein